MKRFKILLSLLLCIAIAACSMLSALAMLAPLRTGDVDRDYSVTILDATLIQRFLAYMREPDELQEVLGDADGDGRMTVLDVTAIQRMLAGMPTAFAERDIYDYFVGDVSFHSSCEIMKAGWYMTGEEAFYVGVPVTFTAKVRWGAKPRAYSLSVDGEVVEQVAAEGNKTAVMTYTFEEEGDYLVTTAAECQYGANANSQRSVKVIPLPDDGRPVITGAVFYDASRMNSGDSTLTVHAAGGTGGYLYRYEVWFGDGEPLYEIPDDEGTPAATNVVYNSDFIEDNTLNLASLVGGIGYWGNSPVISVRITARDSAGNVSDPVTAGYIGYEVLA